MDDNLTNCNRLIPRRITFLNKLTFFTNMEATIANFRMARHHHSPNQMVIEVSGYNDKEKAKALIGKTVVWKSPANKELKGKITNFHGNKGRVRAKFDTGMPGQAVGSKVTIQ
jgi:large subunit ribosomal protein L35Ae